MHNASLMTYPAGPQLNSVLFAWMARDNARRPVSHATTPHRCYLFNLRVLLRAMFSLVAARFISATKSFPAFLTWETRRRVLGPIGCRFISNIRNRNNANLCDSTTSVRRDRLHAELLPSH